jgi:hypothetical protein
MSTTRLEQAREAIARLEQTRRDYQRLYAALTTLVQTARPAFPKTPYRHALAQAETVLRDVRPEAAL